jgi:acetylornithine deacetylase/succinyl-diaminopimelate desuccinylase-like protein
LYGRGGADDGYAICCAILAIKALQEQGIPHGRIVIVIEGSEESGSIHLMDYIDHLKAEIGIPSLIVCLDSGAGNYEQFWTTTSLRGILAANLTVKIINEASHSGHASGIVPSSFRILRQLLDRIDDPLTGELKIKEFYVDVPPGRVNEIKSCAHSLGTKVYKEFTWVKGAKPVSEDVETCLLNRTWRPTLSITGVDGIPHVSNAGNVLRSYTTVKLSIRLPPSLEPKVGAEALQRVLLADPPYGAQVELDIDKFSPGFDAPPFAEWLDASMHKASNYFFKKPSNYVGEGGSIPFMGLLKQKFPEAQFVITGVLGPESNAHGPNEFLHIDFAKRINASVVSILADHGVHFKKH